MDVNSKIQYLCFAEEVGENGTPHFQGYFQLKSQVKMTTFKRWPGWDRMHFDKCLGTDEENYYYCKGPYNKNGKSKPLNPTFWETGERVSMGKPGARNDLKAVEDDIKKGHTYDELCAAHFDTVARYSRFIQERVQAHATQAELNSSLKEYEGVVWKPWQQVVLDLVQEEPDRRRIHWIWESTGSVGKSYLAKYLAAEHQAILLKPGKQTDLSYIISKSRSKLVIFDLSRTNAPTEGREHFLDSSYSLAEDLKNGVIQSTKYDSTTIIRGTSHVIFFANFPPDMTKWSQDRYFITQL